MATIAEEEKKRKLGNAGFPVPPAMDPGPMVGKPGDFPLNPDGTLIQKAAAPTAVAAPTATESGGAVFGFYPQLADNKRTLYATGDKLRQGIVATGPRSFVPALTPAAPMSPMPPPSRMNATTDPRSLTFQGFNPTPQDSATEPQVAVGNPNARTDVQRAGAEAPSTAPDGSPLVTDAASGVRRIDAPGKSPLFTNLPANDPSNQALMARGFGPTAQNTAAAQNLSDRYAGESRGAMAVDQYNAEVAAAQQANKAGLDATLQIERRMQREKLVQQAGDISSRSRAGALLQAVGNMDSVDQRAGEADARTAIEGRKVDQHAAQFGMTNQIAQQKADGEKTKLGFEAQSAAQIKAASDALMTAKTPAERQTAMETLAGLQGKYSPKDTQNRFTVVPGGQAIDEKTGMAYTVPARALDNQTGRFVDQTPGAQKTTPTAASIAKLKTNPAMAKQFDEMFGAGAAAAALK